MLACSLTGASLWGMNNDDVIKMVQAGLGEDTIIMAIKGDDDREYDTSAMGLIQLKEAKVSEAIIQAMINDAQGEGTSTASRSSPLSFNTVDRNEVMPPEISPQVGNTYYTRINFWHEKGKSSGTNYSRGVLVPINTRVKLVNRRRGTFTVELPGGEEVRIENVEKFTGLSNAEFPSRYLADAETKIDLYGEDLARQIRTGVMRLGMTKDHVLLTRGHPPVHETPSLESDQWVYWSSRFVKLTLVFENGILAQGRGLY